MDELVRFNLKVLKVSSIVVIILATVQLIDSLDFYNDYFALASFFTFPILLFSAIVFIYSAILEMKIDTIKKRNIKLTKTTV